MTMPNTDAPVSRADVSGQQGGSTAREQIRDVKNQVVDQAKTTFQQARDRATSSLGESKGQFANQFGTMADALRRTTEHLRSEDQQRIAALTDTAARQVEQIAEYLRGKDARAMREDLENLARRQPALLIGGALILGLIGARFLKSSERRGGRRFEDSERYGREGRFGYSGYTGYNQPYVRGADIDVERQIPGRTGGFEGPESGLGGGYAGA
ncbi:MAG TPA: hypothetical protein VHH32_01165 [Gemmatimonadales bacterium]|nr:hypothetical protein [Gemmatimonadales bacterium]